MSEVLYRRLQILLDTLPNGFPATEDGIEIKILKKIFTPEDAELALHLKIKWETPEQIAERTGLDSGFLSVKLKEMQNNGQIAGASLGGISVYRLIPYIIGIYEYQLNRMDKEFAELAHDYMAKAMITQIADMNPSYMRVVPIKQNVDNTSVIEPHESLERYIQEAKSWAVGDCICKKEKILLGEGCGHTLETCLAIAPIENYFNDEYFWGRPITKEEALDVLKRADEEGLVHMTNNYRKGVFAICNCCPCSCGMFRGLLEFNKKNVIAKSPYYAVVDEAACSACGLCEERCPVSAITVDSAAVIDEKCIGCGLCISSCPSEAIKMARREGVDLPDMPRSNNDWMEQREAARKGSGEYKKLM